MNDLIKTINLRFISGNDTPVERAHITAEEWAQIRRLMPQPPSMRQLWEEAYREWVRETPLSQWPNDPFAGIRQVAERIMADQREYDRATLFGDKPA